VGLIILKGPLPAPSSGEKVGCRGSERIYDNCLEIGGGGGGDKFLFPLKKKGDWHLVPRRKRSSREGGGETSVNYASKSGCRKKCIHKSRAAPAM